MSILQKEEYTWDRTGGDPITKQGNRNPLLYKRNGALMESKQDI